VVAPFGWALAGAGSVGDEDGPDGVGEGGEIGEGEGVGGVDEDGGGVEGQVDEEVEPEAVFEGDGEGWEEEGEDEPPTGNSPRWT